MKLIIITLLAALLYAAIGNAVVKTVSHAMVAHKAQIEQASNF